MNKIDSEIKYPIKTISSNFTIPFYYDYQPETTANKISSVILSIATSDASTRSF
jgi:hypothetical protein